MLGATKLLATLWFHKYKAGLHVKQIIFLKVSTKKMPRIDISTRKQVNELQRAGYSIKVIHNRLLQQGTTITKRSLYRLCKKFHDSHTVLDLPRQKRRHIISSEMAAIIDDMLKENDELTARQIRSKLQEKYPSLSVSLATIKRARKEGGWVCTQPHYCQLIRDANKVKRLEWCEQQITNKEKINLKM